MIGRQQQFSRRVEMERFYVVTGNDTVESIRTEKRAAQDDVRILKEICWKSARIMEGDPRITSAE